MRILKNKNNLLPTQKAKRYERKWVYVGVNYLILFNALLRSNFFFSTQHPKRKVNSIYFDDLSYSSIRQNLDGVSEKVKYRIRWYDSKNVLNKPNFEIKSKKGFESYKKLFDLKELNNLSLLQYENLEYIKEFINNKFGFYKTLYPILTTHYDRDYFLSNNGLIRATLDYNLQSVSLENNRDLNLIKNYYSTITLELKYPINLDSYVRHNLKNISARLSKNSKFVNSALTTATNYS